MRLESALPRLIYFDNDTQTVLKGYVAHALCVRALAKRPWHAPRMRFHR
jgi:hypothetical protein